MATLSGAELTGLAMNVGFTPSQAQIMAAIALAESSGNPAATNKNRNGSTDHGLWQINDKANADIIRLYGDPAQPANNAKMAKAVFDRQGLRAWVVYKTGAYLTRMPQVNASLATIGAGMTADNMPTVKALLSGDLSGALGTLTPNMPFLDAQWWKRAGMIAAGTALITFGLYNAAGFNPIRYAVGGLGTVASDIDAKVNGKKIPKGSGIKSRVKKGIGVAKKARGPKPDLAADMGTAGADAKAVVTDTAQVVKAAS